MKILLISCAFILSALKLYGQNYLFKPSQSGAFVSGNFGVGIGTYSVAYLAGGTLGYSYRGRLSLAVSGLYRGGEKILKTNSLTAAANYMFVKQDKFPISIAADASYSFRRFPEFDKHKNRSFYLGGGIYRRQQFSDKFAIIPGALWGFAQYREGYGKEVAKLNTNIWTIQNSFQFNRFSITPGLSHTGDLWTILTSIAFIIPIKTTAKISVQ